MPNASVELSIVAPMFNEQENVRSTVEAIRQTMRGFPGTWEFVMVNDGSRDGTLAAAQAESQADERIRVVSYAENAGRGKALRTGFAAARGEIIVSTDFDLSYEPGHLLRLHQALKENPELDAVLGSAYMPGGQAIGVPWFRLFLSKVGNRILSRAMGGEFHTITCVLRGYRRRALDALELQSDGKEIHLEILSKLVALGFKVKEIPATLRSRKKGKSKFRFRKTSASHLLFSVLERPMMLFGLIGTLLLTTGCALGLFLLVKWWQGLGDRLHPFNPDRPLMTVLIVLLLGGVQMLMFGILAIQMVDLRRQLYVVQRQNRERRQDSHQ
jgi:glycosyltransferase involved in cell wall biosynthesis